jgi:3',5'-cyclic AMP phosphodiesterase CpdA
MFTLAHLSDPHLAPLPSPRLSELFSKRVTGWLNWYRKRRAVHRRAVLDALVRDLKAQTVNHIAVTGDLTNIAAAAEFPPGRAFLDSLGSPENVTVIPGNHDAYVAEGLQYVTQYWGPFMQGDDSQSAHSRASGNPGPALSSPPIDALGPRFRGDERKDGAFPFVCRRGPIALIGLSTAVPTAPFMATGWLGDKQRARLGETLAVLGRENVFRVVLIHHPPVSKARAHKLMTDAKAFINVLAIHGAELVLHGHDHLHMLNWLDGPRARIPVVGVPSASASADGQHTPAAYNLYSIDGTPGAWRCKMISRGFQRGGGDVVELKRETLAAA